MIELKNPTNLGSPGSIGGVTPGSGTFTSLGTVVTDPATLFALNAFSYPDTYSGPGGWGIQVTWSSGSVDSQSNIANGAAITAQTIVETTAPTVGAPTAVFGSVLYKKTGVDAGGVVGTCAGSTQITQSGGAGVWGIVRAYVNGGSTDPTGDTSDALRGASEVQDNNHPRAGMLVYNTSALNAFQKGAWVQSAQDYAFLAGSGSTGFVGFVEPTYWYAALRTSGSMVFSVNTAGDVTGNTYNKLTVTTPSSGATLTVANGKTVTVSNTVTVKGTDGSTLDIGGGGALGSAAFKNIGTSGANVPLMNGANTWTGANLFTQAFTQLTNNATVGPISSGSGGVAFGWNRSGGSAESNIYNVFNNGAGMDFWQNTGSTGTNYTKMTAMTTAGFTVSAATTIPAGGVTGHGCNFSATTNFGIYFGSGIPTLGAAQGSLYLRSDGSSTTTRMYVATSTASSSGSWASLTASS